MVPKIQTRILLFYYWRRLVNVDPFSLRLFLQSSEAKGQPQYSAKAVLRLKEKGRLMGSAFKNWSDTDWTWAKRQVETIQRLLAIKAPLYDAEGEKTKKHVSLLLWGHDPSLPTKPNPHPQAISRSSPSGPMRYLSKEGLLEGRVLDYGTGYGFDAEHFKIEGYDPYTPQYEGIPSGKFDTIACIYVLNILPLKDREAVIKDVASRLKKNGVAYFAVRRDLSRDVRYATGLGQYVVRLNLTSIKKTADFEIYRMEKGEIL